MAISIRQLETILKDWQAQVTDALSQGFEQMLVSSDQRLAEIIANIEEEEDRKPYYQAQKEIMLKHQACLDLFRHQLRDAFVLKKEDQAQTGSLDFNYETLSLVDIDQYERNLELKKLAARVERDCDQLLYTLACRLASVDTSREAKIEQVPASPHRVSEVFSRCIGQQFQFPKPVLLPLYDLFEQFVLAQLPELYEELNQILLSRGVLPHLKYSLHKKDSAPPKQTESKAAAKDEEPEEQKEALVQKSKQALDKIKSLLASERPKKSLPPGVELASNQEVVQKADELLQQDKKPLPMREQLEQDAPPITRLSQDMVQNMQQAMLAQRQQLKQDIGEERLPENEENIIDLVGLLFEKMLDDERIPDMAKALLGHLHSPYIKIGLRDEQLFIKPDHPARQFLDQATEAAALWIDEEAIDKGIYPLLKQIVAEIIQHKKTDLAHFESYSQQLAQKIELLEQRYQKMGQRTQQTEQGQAAKEEARQAALRLTYDIFNDQTLSEECIQFIEGVWLDYLTLVKLRHQEEDWQEAQQLGHDLLDKQQKWLAGELNRQHLDQLAEQLWQSIGELLPHHARAIEKLIHSLEKKPQSIRLFEMPDPQSTAQAPISKNLKKIIAEIEKLPENTVFEFEQDERRKRVRLAWYNPTSQRCLFVDHRGRKVALMSVQSLALLMEQKKAVYFTDIKESFFSRTLSKIKQILERKKMAPA